MTEWDRLRDGNDLAARLLRAGSGEQPKQATRNRAERALGLSGIAAGALVSSKATATVAASGVAVGGRLAIPTFVKWLALGMFGGGAVLGGSALVRDALDETASPLRSAAPPLPRSRETTQARPAQAERLPAASEAASAAPADELQPKGKTSSNAEGARIVGGSTGHPSTLPLTPDTELPLANGDARLSREVELLERVRAQLRAGQSAQALTELDAIGGEIQSLTTEADLLRVEALLAHGERARAEALAGELRRRGGGQNFRLKRLLGDP